MRYLLKLFLIFLALIFLSELSFSQENSKTATDIVSEACQIAAKEKKNVLIVFTASWCINCHRLEKNILNDSLLKKVFDQNYIIRYLVVKEVKVNKSLETPGALELLTQYQGQNSGIPFFVILDPNGKVLSDSFSRPNGEGQVPLGKNIGCPISEEEISRFVNILEETTKVTPVQIQLVKEICAKAFRPTSL